ncbi:hypothetical protein [Roseateles saccharophilus]|uniref:Uncharacterized protein n=1 Tax=Roseateles saccharophilus TaxID=304 RepID=A0A4R3UHN0_ROSSA|nr:hypothetical protein [Roseateles saccharophilus]MDG0834806.1 hypothetical protein [Roseateles saccharophilus]TCU88928.1 hypothetical protein EV671_103710 [Roseateles saccharophilus]
MISSLLALVRAAAAASLLVTLCACGGGGVDGTAPAATPSSPLAVPVPPAATGDTTVQAAYQPGVRELVSANGGPKLLQSDASGGLVFSAAPGAQVGQVLIVAGRAYRVTAVDASGTQLATRAPELGEVFSSLRIKASVQDASAVPAAAGWARPLASGGASTSFAYDLGAIGPVGLSYKGQLAMKLDLDLDFSAAGGFKTFSLAGDLTLTQTLLLQLQTAASNGSASAGVELTRFSYVIPQTLGLARVDVPVIIQAQASGDAKLSMRVIDGPTHAHVSLRYDPTTGQLQSDGGVDASAGSEAPAATAQSAVSTTSLGLTLKLGPDLQLKLLDTVLPFSASVRANLGVSAQVVSNGQSNCVGWSATLGLEASAKLKRGGGGSGTGDLQATLASSPWPLGSGGDLAACQVPTPKPTPTPTPVPPPTPAPVVDGLALLPMPAGAELLTDYQLVLATDAFTPDVKNVFNESSLCWQQPFYGLQAELLETVAVCAHTLQPQIRRADASVVNPEASDDWVIRFGSPGMPSCAADLVDPLLGVTQGGVVRTHEQGSFVGALTYFIGPTAVHTNRLSLVCQLQVTERTTGKSYVLRSPVWTSPTGKVAVSGVTWTWVGD